MPTGKRPELPAELRSLQGRIAKWRRTRGRRTAMPAELWTEAVALAPRVGAYRVARTLRLNFDGLRRRVAEATLAGSPPTPGAFVEVSGAQLLDAAIPIATVEVQDERGMRLVVKGAPVDVVALVTAFRRS